MPAAANMMPKTTPSLESSTSNSTKTNNFLTYENLSYALRIKYPATWEKTQSYVLRFISPPGNNIDRSHAMFIISWDLARNESLNSIVNSIINYYNSPPYTYWGYTYGDLPQHLNNFKIIDLEKTVLANNTAYKLGYTYTNPQPSSNGFKNSITEATDIYTIHNNAVYIVTFNATQPNYYYYLPTVQKMIDSIEFINATNVLTGILTNGNPAQIAKLPLNGSKYFPPSNAILLMNLVKVINHLSEPNLGKVLHKLSATRQTVFVQYNLDFVKLFTKLSPSDIEFVFENMSSVPVWAWSLKFDKLPSATIIKIFNSLPPHNVAKLLVGLGNKGLGQARVCEADIKESSSEQSPERIKQTFFLRSKFYLCSSFLL